MEQMQVRHYLTFEFAGMRGKFLYMVSEDVKNSVRHDFLQRDWEIEGPVIEFEDTSGRKIAVNARYVRRCQALFEAGIYPTKDKPESKPDMTFVIEGMSEPLNYDDIEPADAELIASVMAGTEDRICNFISFLDEDGEDNVIPADKIMLLESIHYDDELDEELPEESESE
jgi:hypothetical protein